jgi:hypothetical protein
VSAVFIRPVSLVRFALIRVGRPAQRLSAGLGPIRLYQRVQQRLAPFLTSTGSGALMWLVLEVPGRRTGVIRRTRLVKADSPRNVTWRLAWPRSS